ncbi:MAG: hypothetical protein WAK31_00595 [Chthoniobacterales bacterium]
MMCDTVACHGMENIPKIPEGDKVSLNTIGLASEAVLSRLATPHRPRKRGSAPRWRPLIGLRYHPVTAVDRVV